jgi:hypothetical protein
VRLIKLVAIKRDKVIMFRESDWLKNITVTFGGTIVIILRAVIGDYRNPTKSKMPKMKKNEKL